MNIFVTVSVNENHTDRKLTFSP